MEDIIGIIFGWYLLELTGAIVRFALSYALQKLKGNKTKKFSHFYKVKGSALDEIDNNAANRIAGGLTLIILLLLLFSF